MLAYFYSLDTSTIIALDAVTSLRESYTGDTADHNVESGFKNTDNYVLDQKVVNITGVVTDTKVIKGRNDITISQFKYEVTEMMKSSVPFTLNIERDGIDSIPNALITAFSVEALGADGLSVNLTFKEVNFVEKARKEQIFIQDGSKESVSSAENKGDASTSSVDKDKAKKVYENTVGRGIAENLADRQTVSDIQEGL